MTADVFLNLFETAVLLFVFLGTIRPLVRGGRSLRMVFFAFAVACALLSNFYWLAYDILRPGTRMPFAANEIGEWALFLLLGASLRIESRLSHAKWEMLCAALFAAANAALWIAWSGEWVEDILTGAAFGYFLCCLVAMIKQEGAFSVREWRLLGAACLVLIAAQTATFSAPDTMRRPLDLFCYILLFAVAAFLLLRAIWELRSGGQAPLAVCRTFAAFAWGVAAMYMSAGGFYIAALLLTTLCWPMLLLALRKEAAA